jgi:hypothetical protein
MRLRTNGSRGGFGALARGFFSIGCAVAVTGCKCGAEREAEGGGPASSAQAKATAVSSATAAAPLPSTRPSFYDTKVVPTSWPVPTGPRFGILAGAGIGPIRIGANTNTIERLMDKPCEIKTETQCKYISRAVEFDLDEKGFTKEIHMHRVERPTTPKGQTFGMFNGRMPEGVTFLMLESGVREILGPPLRTEAITAPNDWNMVAVHHYKGLRIEYDRIPNGNVVVGGIVITKPAP